jgi:hypothetical protein
LVSARDAIRSAYLAARFLFEPGPKLAAKLAALWCGLITRRNLDAVRDLFLRARLNGLGAIRFCLRIAPGHRLGLFAGRNFLRAPRGRNSAPKNPFKSSK